MADYKSNADCDKMPAKRNPIKSDRVENSKPKLLERLALGDRDSIKDYVVNDVIIPYAKDFLSEFVNGVTDIFLYGGSTNNPLKKRVGGGLTPYSSMYIRGGKKKKKSAYVDDYADMPRPKPHEFRIESNIKAKEALSELKSIINEYGFAKVSDAYEICTDIVSDEQKKKMATEWTDHSVCWRSLDGIEPRRIPGGGGYYFIPFPKPEPVER